MLSWLAIQFAGLWPMIWHFGIGGVIVIGCGLLYAFTPAFLSRLFPNIQKILLWVATIVVTIMISTAIGVSLGEKRVQSQWDAARVVTVDKTKKARAGAIRDVARKPSRWVRSRPDPDIRD